MTTDTYSVIIVPATSHAVRAEKILVQAGTSCRLIPVPRQISSNCGICLRVKQADRDTAVKILVENGILLEKTADLESVGKLSTFFV